MQTHESFTKKEFILDYLAQKGKEGAFVNEMYNAWKQYARSVPKKDGNYASFRVVISTLKNERYIEPFKYEKLRTSWNRTYYRLMV